jgi:hypothetical protein
MCRHLPIVLIVTALSSIALTQAAPDKEKRKEENVPLAAQLERPLPAVNFEKVALTDAIDFLRDVSDVNLFVNWRALKAAGVDRQQPVSVRLRNVKFSKVLSLILNEAAGKEGLLAWHAADGVINISTAEELNKITAIKVYEVRDLLDPTKVDKKGEILMQMISEAVAPQSWVEAGGSAGTIKFMDGQLIIAQTAENHKAIGGLLAALREFQK